MATIFKTGCGFDVHAFCAGRPLVLGGVTIPCEFGLAGHSDADALTHAICDAILGALGLGDIGGHFPDTDPQYKNINSLLLLERVLQLARENSAEVVHIDATVIAQQPRIAPHRDAICASLRELLQPATVNIKATTTEGLGFTGRREGLAAQAVATLRFDPR